MPFTPFHFGPGLLIKSLAGRWFWLTSFMAANVLIDVEVLYYLWKHSRPYHRYAHTYLGGTIAGIIAGAAMFAAILLAPRILPPRWVGYFSTGRTKTTMLWQSLAAGLAGGITHIFLDSLLHAEVQPFWPFAAGNEFYGLISGRMLYMCLTLLGLLGGCLWLQAYLAADR